MAGRKNRLNFQDRIAPPAESWRVLHTATGGTYRIEITLGGLTSTSAPIAFNASSAAMESALNSLPNVVAAAGSFSLARRDFSPPLTFVGHGVAGASLNFNASTLTGGTLTILGLY